VIPAVFDSAAQNRIVVLSPMIKAFLSAGAGFAGFGMLPPGWITYCRSGWSAQIGVGAGRLPFCHAPDISPFSRFYSLLDGPEIPRVVRRRTIGNRLI
jgi:hypothetical protein